MPPEKLMAAVKRLEEAAMYTPPLGLYAEAQGDVHTGDLSSGFKTWEKSPYYRDRLKAEHKRGHQANIAWNLPPLKKRTDRERVESFTKRLLDAIEKQPWEADMILRGAAAESWKKGHPISFDELKAIAAPFIEQAQKEAAKKRPTRPPEVARPNG